MLSSLRVNQGTDALRRQRQSKAEDNGGPRYALNRAPQWGGRIVSEDTGAPVWSRVWSAMIVLGLQNLQDIVVLHYDGKC